MNDRELEVLAKQHKSHAIVPDLTIRGLKVRWLVNTSYSSTVAIKDAIAALNHEWVVYRFTP